jgi:nicotinate-nucleotide adenylyltransferase
MKSTLGARRRIAANLPPAGAGQRIGLLGGSFNPPHDGHLQISRIARARLGLDAVWWLVSPQNPLKSPDDTPPPDQRAAEARALAKANFIRVTTLEDAIGARYSIETVRFLRQAYPDVRFVWIIGADNLAIFHRWRCWREIASLIPLAVIDRPGAGLAAIASPAAAWLARRRLDEDDAKALAMIAPPVWTFIHGPLSPLSSTAIREAG